MYTHPIHGAGGAPRQAQVLLAGRRASAGLPFLPTGILPCPFLSTGIHSCRPECIPVDRNGCLSTGMYCCPFLSTICIAVHSCRQECIPVDRNVFLTTEMYSCPFLSSMFPCAQTTPGLAGGRRRRHGRHTYMNTYTYIRTFFITCRFSPLAPASASAASWVFCSATFFSSSIRFSAVALSFVFWSAMF